MRVALETLAAYERRRRRMILLGNLRVFSIKAVSFAWTATTYALAMALGVFAAWGYFQTEPQRIDVVSVERYAPAFVPPHYACTKNEIQEHIGTCLLRKRMEGVR